MFTSPNVGDQQGELGDVVDATTAVQIVPEEVALKHIAKPQWHVVRCSMIPQHYYLPSGL